AAQIDKKQAIGAVVGEEAQGQRLRAQHGAVQAARALEAKHRVFAPQFQEIAMKGVDLGVAPPVFKVQLTALERVRITRIRQASLHLRHGQTAKLSEELVSAVEHLRRQLRVVVCEIQKRSRRRELLALKEHRRTRRQE